MLGKKMEQSDKYTANAEAWDSGQLGQDEQFVNRVDSKHEDSLNEAMGLQMISIRLPKKLIEDLKFIATAHGIGYQPLIKDVLCRFAQHEVNDIIKLILERNALEAREQEERKNKSKQKKAA
jgi:predicted DNA binding CopG/RHH family protein